MRIEGTNEVILTVAEYVDRLNVALGVEAGYVEGEVVGFKESPQWVFFSLQDSGGASGYGGAVLSCGLLAHEYKRIGVRIEDGMKVKIFGNPRITPKSGRFGMWVKSIEPVGEGSLKKAYELLVKKLKEEGLFTRKRELPEFVSRIGVISSREGVVLQDLRKNLRKLNFRISFVHTQVEGAAAVPGILRALRYFHNNHANFDLVVVIRGGGSLESLQAFNNEEVVRAMYAMPVPVIAGIGHDVDVPIAALVADREGSTPTAVAHIINSTWDTLVEGLPRLGRELLNSMTGQMHHTSQKAVLLLERMTGYFGRLFRSFDALVARVERGCARVGEKIDNIRDYILSSEKLLVLVDPARNLRLGYSLTLHRGKVVKKAGDVRMGDELETRVSDGSVKSVVKK